MTTPRITPQEERSPRAIIVSVLLLVLERSIAVMTTQPCGGAWEIEVKYSAAQ